MGISSESQNDRRTVAGKEQEVRKEQIPRQVRKKITFGRNNFL